VLVTLTWSSAQQAGDLNVISIGVVTPNTITSVTDSIGNSYLQAVSATKSLSGSQTLYYAANIQAAAAGANTVTVTFNGGTGGNVKANVGSQLVGGVSMAEYSGIVTTNPLDVATGAGGTSSSGGTASSGQASTTNANDLLIGGYWAGSTGGTAGTGYTMRTGGIEDRTVTATGSYSATATVASPGGWWVVLLAAFRAASSGSVCD